MTDRWICSTGMRRTELPTDALIHCKWCTGAIWEGMWADNWSRALAAHTALAKGLHSVLLVRGDKHQGGECTYAFGGFYAVHTGHVHIQKRDLWRVGIQQLDRLAAIAGGRHDTLPR